MAENSNRADLPQATLVPKKRTRVSVVWVIPIFAAIVALGIAVHRILNEGPTIAVVFKSAEGVEAGKTVIKYKDVIIGQVKAVELADDFTKVLVTAQIAKHAEGLMVEDAKFWVVEPRITLSGVSGLGTLLSGNYIGFEIGTSHKKQRRFAVRVALFASLAVLAGCASPASRFYTLSAADAPAAPVSDLSVVVGPVSVPAAVDRPEIVVTTGPNRVRLEEFDRWASPLKDDISRVVAQNLAAMLGTAHVTQFPQTSSADAGYRATIEVQAFASTPGQTATLDAVWTVRRPKDGKSKSGRTTVHETVPQDGYDALVAAHSRAIARLSRDIADAVRALDRAAG